MLFWLYNLFFLPATLVYLVYFAFSNRRGLLKGLGGELGERLALYPDSLLNRLGGRPVIWFHAASLGEVKAVEPLIARVKKERPGCALVLTSSNSVARAQGGKIAGLDAAILAPLDFYPLARRAVRLLKPQTLILVETELWPGMIRAARRSGAKIAVVNARLSARSLRRYRWVASVMRGSMSSLDLVAAQTARDAARFIALGAPDTKTAAFGNLKHDRFFDETPDLAPVRERLSRLGWTPKDVVFVAASTHRGEETAAIAAFKAARELLPQARMILAPRHLERLREVEVELNASGLSYARWRNPQPADVLLLDAVGVLPSLFGVARAAFVGGTLAPRGGHNLLEPVRFSVPVLFGPHVDNVQEVAELLLKSGGGIQVQDAAGLAIVLPGLLADEDRCRRLGRAGREAAESLKGATARTLARLLPLL